MFTWGLSRLLCPPRPRDQQHNSGPSDSSSIQAKLNKQRARLDSIHHVPIPFPAPHPALLYDQVSLNETVSKSSFLFHTDNIIFIKLIFQEALFYSDFPEPGEIILFLPLGLKENLSITNVCQQHNFFCKKFDIAEEKSIRLEIQTPSEAFGKGSPSSKTPSSVFLPGLRALRVQPRVVSKQITPSAAWKLTN